MIEKAILEADEVTRGKLITELEGSVVKVGTDLHGYHVIREAVNTADDVTRRKLILELVGNGLGD